MQQQQRIITEFISMSKARKLSIPFRYIAWAWLVFDYKARWIWAYLTYWKQDRGFHLAFYPTLSRSSSHRVCVCLTCLWVGKEKNTVHTYKYDRDLGTEAINLCPSCKKEI